MKSSRNLSYDLVRFVGIIYIVCVHVAAEGFYQFSPNWSIINFFSGPGHICVPLFFMLSGALLLRKEETFSQLSKRILKIAIPLIFWSSLFVAWARHFGSTRSYFSILEGPVTVHLWFCYSIIGAYLFFPVLRAFIKVADTSTVTWIICCWAFGITLNNILIRFFSVRLGIDFSFFSPYLGYFLLGDLIARKKKHSLLFSGLGWLVSTIVIVVGTDILSHSVGHPDEFLLNCSSLPLLLSSIFAFQFLLEAGKRIPQSQALRWVIQSLSTASFGMYLMHPFVLDFLAKRHIHQARGPVLIWIPVTTLLGLCISWAIVRGIQKVPYLRAVCPG